MALKHLATREWRIVRGHEVYAVVDQEQLSRAVLNLVVSVYPGFAQAVAGPGIGFSAPTSWYSTEMSCLSRFTSIAAATILTAAQITM